MTQPLPDFLMTGACGDVVAARGEAERLLSGVGGDRLVRRLAGLILTAAIVDLKGRVDRGLKPSDIIPLLITLIPPSGRPFANSPMQFLQFADAELAELDQPCRSAAIELCIAATSNSGKLPRNGKRQENSKKTA